MGFPCSKALQFFAKIVIVLLTINGVSAINQTISFFTSEDCKGNNITFFDTTESIPETVKSSHSFLVEYGAWRVFDSTSTSSSSSGQSSSNDTKTTAAATTIWNVNTDYKICRSTSSSFAYMQKIERIGERDLDSDSITLYPEANYMGTPVVINKTGELASSVQIKSWAITGTKGWAVFAEKDLQGGTVCLNVSSPTGSWPIVTLESPQDPPKGPFMSVQQGCSGCGSLTVFFKLLVSLIVLHFGLPTF